MKKNSSASICAKKARGFTVSEIECEAWKADGVCHNLGVHEMFTLSKATDPMEGLERTMDRYFRRDPILEATASITRRQAELKHWVESSAENIGRLKQALDSEINDVNRMRAEIEQIDQRMMRAGRDVQASLNSTRNLLVEKHNELSASFTHNQKNYNELVHTHNSECERRQAALADAHRAALTECDAFNSWLEHHGRADFSAELNGLYASFSRVARQQKTVVSELAARLKRTRALRKELAEYAIAQEENRPNGMLIVPALLGGDEEVFLTVDTGSNLVTIEPEIIDALGWNDRIGREIEVALPAGIRVKCRETLLPSLEVHGFKARDVQAVVLKETQPGVDGLLGLSFLNQFNYQIVRQHPRRLALTVFDQNASASR
jgi:predicted aspartyl protease